MKKKNRLDQDRAFYKVVESIKSCKTHQQLYSANNMIENFRRMFKDDRDYSQLLDVHFHQIFKVD